mgnify:CR=1 FL=1
MIQVRILAIQQLGAKHDHFHNKNANHGTPQDKVYNRLATNGAYLVRYVVKHSELGAFELERLLLKEKINLDTLVKNITSILPEYEKTGKKHAYGKRSHSSVLNALRRFSEFLAEGTN